MDTTKATNSINREVRGKVTNSKLASVIYLLTDVPIDFMLYDKFNQNKYA